MKMYLNESQSLLNEVKFPTESGDSGFIPVVVAIPFK